MRRKEGTEKMLYDLKICDNNVYVQLKNIRDKSNSAAGFNKVGNGDEKISKNKNLLRRLIFCIEKVPRHIKEEIKNEKSYCDENVFSKYIKEEVDDSQDDLFKIDDMMDLNEDGNKFNRNSNEEFRNSPSDYIIKGNDNVLGKKRNPIHFK